MADSEPPQLLDAASNAITQLTHNSSLVGPLTCHTTVLAALALNKLTDVGSTAAEAEENLKTLVESRIAPSRYDEAIRGLITSKKQAAAASVLASSSSVESKHTSTVIQGLQHLAELATADEEGRDPAPLEQLESRTEETFRERTGPDSALGQSSIYADLRETFRCGYMSVLAGEAGR
jgi:hypothetical protein